MKSPLALLAFLAVLLAAIYLLGLFLANLTFAWPRRFKYGGETYRWIPDKGGRRSFLARRYEYGSFQYEDGTPVTDPHSIHLLQVHWVQSNRAWDRRWP